MAPNTIVSHHNGQAHPQVANIPQFLQDIPRWVVWGWGPADQRGKRAKKPASPIDGTAKNWKHRLGDFSQATEALNDRFENRFAGVGWLPDASVNVTIIDLDSCVEDGSISGVAQFIIDEAGTYAETSPSGTGIRLICRGTLNNRINDPGLLESGQDDRKFFTLTGHHLTGTPPDAMECQAFLDRLPEYHQLLKADRAVRTAPSGTGNDTLFAVTKDLVKSASFDQGIVEAVMLDAATFGGRRSTTEAEATIQSAIQSVEKDLQVLRTAFQLGTRHQWIATILADAFAGKYRWVWNHKRWIQYHDGWWDFCDERKVVAEAMTLLHHQLVARLQTAGSPKEIKAIQEQIALVNNRYHVTQGIATLAGLPGFHTEAEDLDAHPWLLNLPNGTLDLRTRTLMPHNPDHLITKIAGVSFSPHASADEWLAHINRLLPDPDIRRQVQRDLGTSLVGETLAEFLPLWIGNGSNGKTTTAQVLQGVLGDYCIQAAPNLLVRKRFEDHPTGLADLAGSRLVFASELEEGQELNEQLVKQLTGGDTQKARFMRGDFFDFKPTFTTVLYANNKPVIKGVDNGIWRRVRLIQWEVVIPPAERRPQAEMVRELVDQCGPGILNWALDGLDDYLADPSWTASGVDAATQAYKSEQDFLADFTSDYLVRTSGAKTKLSDVYDAYLEYCMANGDRPLGKVKFNAALAARGYAKERGTGNAWVWIGVQLKSPYQGSAEETSSVFDHAII